MAKKPDAVLPLNLGYSNRKDTPIFLSLDARLNHTAFYGKNIYGKSSAFLKLIQEELNYKEIGLTVIVDSEYLGSDVFTLAKEAKRTVKWLSPSVDIGVKRQLLWEQNYEEAWMDEFILDYERAVRTGMVVIIDLEPYKYFEHYDQAIRLLLFHLQTKLVKMKRNERKPHLIYVENGKRHLPSLEFFFEQGFSYQCGVMLWVDSFADIIVRHPKSRVHLETQVLNNFLYSKLAPADFAHFQSQFANLTNEILRERTGKGVYYSLLNREGGRFNQGLYSMYHFSDAELDDIREKSKRRYTRAVKELAKKENIVDEVIAEQAEKLEIQAISEEPSVELLMDELVKPAQKVKPVPQHEQRQSLSVVRAGNFKRHYAIEEDLNQANDVALWPDI